MQRHAIHPSDVCTDTRALRAIIVKAMIDAGYDMADPREARRPDLVGQINFRREAASLLNLCARHAADAVYASPDCREATRELLDLQARLEPFRQMPTPHDEPTRAGWDLARAVERARAKKKVFDDEAQLAQNAVVAALKNHMFAIELRGRPPATHHGNEVACPA